MVRQWHAKWQKVAEEDLRLSPHGQHMLRWNAWVCVENYFAIEDPNGVTPAGIEDEVFAEVAGVPMLGYMDRWLVEDDGAVIQDYKTGKVSRPPYDTEEKLQLYIYTDLVQTLKSVKVKRAELLYLKGKGKRVSYTPTEDDLSAMRDTVRTVWTDLETACATGVFPTNRTRLCDWCFHKPTCPAWQRSK
jgi:putative RecB family exonuclease